MRTSSLSKVACLMHMCCVLIQTGSANVIQHLTHSGHARGGRAASQDRGFDVNMLQGNIQSGTQPNGAHSTSTLIQVSGVVAFVVSLGILTKLVAVCTGCFGPAKPTGVTNETLVIDGPNKNKRNNHNEEPNQAQRPASTNTSQLAMLASIQQIPEGPTAHELIEDDSVHGRDADTNTSDLTQTESTPFDEDSSAPPPTQQSLAIIELKADISVLTRLVGKKTSGDMFNQLTKLKQKLDVLSDDGVWNSDDDDDDADNDDHDDSDVDLDGVEDNYDNVDTTTSPAPPQPQRLNVGSNTNNSNENTNEDPASTYEVWLPSTNQTRDHIKHVTRRDRKQENEERRQQKRETREIERKASIEALDAEHNEMFNRIRADSIASTYGFDADEAKPDERPIVVQDIYDDAAQYRDDDSAPSIPMRPRANTNYGFDVDAATQESDDANTTAPLESKQTKPEAPEPRDFSNEPWLVDFSRDKATGRIARSLDGTFLVRHSDSASSGLVITAVVGPGRVVHYTVNKDPDSNAFFVRGSDVKFYDIGYLLQAAVTSKLGVLPLLRFATAGPVTQQPGIGDGVVPQDDEFTTQSESPDDMTLPLDLSLPLETQLAIMSDNSEPTTPITSPLTSPTPSRKTTPLSSAHATPIASPAMSPMVSRHVSTRSSLDDAPSPLKDNLYPTVTVQTQEVEGGPSLGMKLSNASGGTYIVSLDPEGLMAAALAEVEASVLDGLRVQSIDDIDLMDKPKLDCVNALTLSMEHTFVFAKDKLGYSVLATDTLEDDLGVELGDKLDWKERINTIKRTKQIRQETEEQRLQEATRMAEMKIIEEEEAAQKLVDDEHNQRLAKKKKAMEMAARSAALAVEQEREREEKEKKTSEMLLDTQSTIKPFFDKSETETVHTQETEETFEEVPSPKGVQRKKMQRASSVKIMARAMQDLLPTATELMPLAQSPDGDTMDNITEDNVDPDQDSYDGFDSFEPPPPPPPPPVIEEKSSFLAKIGVDTSRPNLMAGLGAALLQGKTSLKGVENSEPRDEVEDNDGDNSFLDELSNRVSKRPMSANIAEDIEAEMARKRADSVTSLDPMQAELRAKLRRRSQTVTPNPRTEEEWDNVSRRGSNASDYGFDASELKSKFTARRSSSNIIKDDERRNSRGKIAPQVKPKTKQGNAETPPPPNDDTTSPKIVIPEDQVGEDFDLNTIPTWFGNVTAETTKDDDDDAAAPELPTKMNKSSTESDVAVGGALASTMLLDTNFRKEFAQLRLETIKSRRDKMSI